jgi:gliding motility-associated-like protein
MPEWELNCGKKETSINRGYSVNDFYLSSVGYMRLKRIVIFYLVSGLIIILCHTSGLAPAFPSLTYSKDIFTSSANRPEDRFPSDRGKKPKAVNDFTSTSEGTPVTINVLLNDEEGGKGDDDDDDADNEIDIATVDLNPSTQPIDQSFGADAGLYVVNSIGEVTYTPGQDYSGTAILQYTVKSRGEETSNPATITILVAEKGNAKPVITGQTPSPLTTPEEQAITIQLENLTVSDDNNAYPTGFTLHAGPGDNYSVANNTVTPAANFSGVLSIPVTVSDGTTTSDPFSLQLAVSNVNDAPVITAQTPNPVTTEEDQSLTIGFGHLQVSDPDNIYPTNFMMTVSGGTDYTVSGTTVIPASNFWGSLSVPVTVNDGTVTSDPFILQITVNPVNDVPVITGQSTVTTNENQGIQLDLSMLTVVDPDNTSGFTLSVLPGDNYTPSGTTVTPVSGFNGTLAVGVQVSDGTNSSDVFSLQITVNPVNDVPVINGQSPLTVTEDNALTIQLADLFVTDSDNQYPTGFSLAISAGTFYAVSGNTITPVQNFTGTLSVSVQVSDGISLSLPFSLQIEVTPVNDAPVITSQQALDTNEDQPITIDASHLIVADPDNSYPSGFTLLAFSGDNYALSGTTVTPTTDFQGTLSVPVQVYDGSLNSNVFELQVIVNATNDVPVITGQIPVGTQEDTPVTIRLADLTVLDPDNSYPNGFTLSVSPGTSYSVSGSTITPAQDFTGTLNISVTVNDGLNTSLPFVFQIQVGDANDPPVITGQIPLATNEEQPITVQLSNLLVSDPDNPYPVGFSILLSAGENFTVLNNVITPSLNFAGVIAIPVRVNDGVNNSATFELKVTVNQVNDAPGFDAIANQSVAENATPADVIISNISKGPGEDSQQLTFVATSGNTAVIPDPAITYNGTGSSATLRYRPVANASGVVTITVVAIDNGSAGSPHQNTYSASFQVQIAEINSAPTLDAISNVLVAEDAGLQTVALNGITAGAGESQPLSIEVSSDKPELFEVLQVVYASPQSTGSLQIQSKANVFGSAKITVKVMDNGSSISPSINLILRTFTFVVNPVNDAPVFVSIPVGVAAVSERYEYILAITDLENNALPFSVSVKPAWLTLAGMGNGKARLSGVPPGSALGPSLVKITVNDGDLVVEQSFTLIVNTRPVVKKFSIQTNEDTEFTFQNGFQQSYSDADNHPMVSVLITQLPSFGTLMLGSEEVNVNDTIAATAVATLKYQPVLNYWGADAFYWNGFDGYHHSLSQASVDVTVRPVNDPPSITLETDTLRYEVNGEPAFVTTLFAIEDPDDDSLMRADIAFRVPNFLPEYDQLIFHNSPAVKGFYDYTTGKLSLTGKATLSEYAQAIRSIQYTHLNTLDPELKIKDIFITLNDGEASSAEADRLIMLQYTFIELEIPSGFTPNGDLANDKWIISRPGGIEKLKDAEIKIFNKRGIQVFRTNGFDQPWDGTLNGEVLPADSYFYMIDLNLRSKKTYRGIVILLR